MLKRIHINQHVIKKNNKTGERKKCITVKTSKTNMYCHEVEIKGSCKVVYRPDKPLSCGAKVWIEVDSGIPVVLHETYPDRPDYVKEEHIEYLNDLRDSGRCNMMDYTPLMREFTLDRSVARGILRNWQETFGNDIITSTIK